MFLIEEGVAVKCNGKYWGEQYSDELIAIMDYSDIMKAKISDPAFCKKPTDMTWNPENTLGYNPDYDKLSKGELVKVRKIITVEEIGV